MNPNMEYNHKTVLLNVGSGRYPMAGFTNLDNSIFLKIIRWYPIIRPFLSADYRTEVELYRKAVSGNKYVVHNCLKPLPYVSETVSHILCSHFLEHVYRDEALRILQDFRRVLVPGGTVHAIVPSIATQVRTYLASSGDRAADDFIANTILSTPARPNLRYRLMEIGGSFGLQHRWMYDPRSFRALFQDAGFSILEENQTPSREWRKVPNDKEIELVAKK